ncbi:MAG: cytochrome P460 family protein [Planctomycetales bacterium]|nr:cytochrome P460 family protein [Planctomycetales bacterium]
MTIRTVANPRFKLLAWLALVSLTFDWYAAKSQSDDVSATGSRPSAKSARGPQYNDKGELKLPADYLTWVFVGANLGLEYREDGAAEPAPDKKPEKPVGNFHNVYINPEAYEVYAKTGTFPEKTMLVLDVYKSEAGAPKSVVSEGRFPGKQMGIAVAVKNSARPDGSKTDWAYYDFALDQAAARAFPDKACYDCHLAHADDDKVWVQFYPTLKRIRTEHDLRAKKK